LPRFSRMGPARMRTIGHRCSNGYKWFTETARRFGPKEVSGGHVLPQ
jgi:hypothetical protein